MYTAVQLVSLLALLPVAVFGATPAASLASQYGLTETTQLPFPTANTADVATFALTNNQWSLSKGKIQNGGSQLAFVDDPFPTSTSGSPAGPVLEVTYVNGAAGSSNSGSQFYSFWNGSYQSVLLSYEVAFDKDFDWVKGGKLPGLRGGNDINGCDGGKQPNGTDCFSTRLMWRNNAQGEAYAYVNPVDNLCKDNYVDCNDDFGTSMGRGLFGFTPGAWNKVSLLVRLNNPPNKANGILQLYYNDELAVNQTNLQYRSADKINSVGGLFFSTFYGGSDSSWAPPKDEHSYFRNFQMWGSTTPSDTPGNIISGASHLRSGWSGVVLALVVALGFAF